MTGACPCKFGVEGRQCDRCKVQHKDFSDTGCEREWDLAKTIRYRADLHRMYFTDSTSLASSWYEFDITHAFNPSIVFFLGCPPCTRKLQGILDKSKNLLMTTETKAHEANTSLDYYDKLNRLEKNVENVKVTCCLNYRWGLHLISTKRIHENFWDDVVTYFISQKMEGKHVNIVERLEGHRNTSINVTIQSLEKRVSRTFLGINTRSWNL